MTRLLSPLILLAAIAATVPAAPVPVGLADPTKDREGNPLPKGATARLGSLAFRETELQGLSLSLQGVSFSPNGKELLAVRETKLRVWDATSGKLLPPRVFAPQGTRLVGNGVIVGDRLVGIGPWEPGTNSPTVLVLRVANGKELMRFTVPGNPRLGPTTFPVQMPVAAVTGDGRYLAYIHGDTLLVFDLNSGKELRKIEFPRAVGLHAAPDGKTLFVRERGKPLRQFELPGGKELPSLEGSEAVDWVEVSPDGKRVVTRGRHPRKDEKGRVLSLTEDDFLTVWDPATGKPTGKLEVGSRPQHFRFAGSDALVVFARKVRPPGPFIDTLSRWTVSTGKRRWQVPATSAQALTVSPDGKRVALTNSLGITETHDALTGKPDNAPPVRHSTYVGWIGFAPDGETVTTASDGEVLTWALTGELKRAATPPELRDGWIQPPLIVGRLTWPTYSADGKTAELIGWDDVKGEVGWRVALGGDIPERVYSHDGKRVVGVWPDAQAKKIRAAVYDGPAGKVPQKWDVPGATYVGGYVLPPLALSGDGRLLFVGGDGVVGADVTTGKETVRVNTGKVTSIGGRVMSPLGASADGGRIAVTDEKGVHIYDVKADKKLAEHTLGRLYSAAVQFSPSGKQVAVLGGPIVYVCDTESSEVAPRKFEVPGASPTCVAFSPNNASLAVGYRDGTALVWDLTAK